MLRILMGGGEKILKIKNHSNLLVLFPTSECAVTILMPPKWIYTIIHALKYTIRTILRELKRHWQTSPSISRLSLEDRIMPTAHIRLCVTQYF